MALVHELEADDDTRVRLVPCRPGRLLVVPDHASGVDDLDVGGVGRQKPAHRRLVADEDDMGVRAGGLQRTPHDVGGRVVAASRINDNAHDSVAVARAPGGRDVVW